MLQDIATAVASHDPGATVVLLGDFNVVPSDECWRWEVGRASGWRCVKQQCARAMYQLDSACLKCCTWALWCLHETLRWLICIREWPVALANARAAIYEGTVCTTVKDSAWDNVWLRAAGPCQHVPAAGPVYRYHDTIAERCAVR